MKKEMRLFLVVLAGGFVFNAPYSAVAVEKKESFMIGKYLKILFESLRKYTHTNSNITRFVVKIDNILQKDDTEQRKKGYYILQSLSELMALEDVKLKAEDQEKILKVSDALKKMPDVQLKSALNDLGEVFQEQSVSEAFKTKLQSKIEEILDDSPENLLERTRKIVDLVEGVLKKENLKKGYKVQNVLNNMYEIMTTMEEDDMTHKAIEEAANLVEKDKFKKEDDMTYKAIEEAANLAEKDKFKKEDDMTHKAIEEAANFAETHKFKKLSKKEKKVEEPTKYFGLKEKWAEQGASEKDLEALRNFKIKK